MILGWSGLAAQSIMFLILFTLAYSRPDKMSTIAIDVLGEANLEMFINIILLPCQIYFLVKTAMYIKHGDKNVRV